MPKPGPVALLLAIFLPASMAASAQVPVGTPMPCAARAELVRQLGATYQEAPVSLGVQKNGYLLEVFASSDTGSWTIVSTAPDGAACVVAAGEHWQSLASGEAGAPI